MSQEARSEQTVKQLVIPRREDLLTWHSLNCGGRGLHGTQLKSAPSLTGIVLNHLLSQQSEASLSLPLAHLGTGRGWDIVDMPRVSMVTVEPADFNDIFYHKQFAGGHKTVHQGRMCTVPYMQQT